MQRPHVHVKDGRIINQPFNSKRRSDYAESLQKKTERTLSPSTNLLTLLILSLRYGTHPPSSKNPVICGQYFFTITSVLR